VTAPALDPDALRRIRAGYDRIAPAAFCEAFFAHLFDAMPEVRPLLPPELAAHGEYVEAAIAVVLRNLGDLFALERPLEELGAEHVRRGITPEQLAAAHPVLVATMRTLAGERWTAHDERDWSAAFSALLTLMVRGAMSVSRATSLPR
jgi:hemoglobin-like flavoprotein